VTQWRLVDQRAQWRSAWPYKTKQRTVAISKLTVKQLLKTTKSMAKTTNTDYHTVQGSSAE